MNDLNINNIDLNVTKADIDSSSNINITDTSSSNTKKEVITNVVSVNNSEIYDVASAEAEEGCTAYIAEKGDTFASIAKVNNISINELKRLNPDIIGEITEKDIVYVPTKEVEIELPQIKVEKIKEEDNNLIDENKTEEVKEENIIPQEETPKEEPSELTKYKGYYEKAYDQDTELNPDTYVENLIEELESSDIWISGELDIIDKKGISSNYAKIVANYYDNLSDEETIKLAKLYDVITRIPYSSEYSDDYQIDYCSILEYLKRFDKNKKIQTNSFIGLIEKNMDNLDKNCFANFTPLEKNVYSSILREEGREAANQYINAMKDTIYQRINE